MVASRLPVVLRLVVHCTFIDGIPQTTEAVRAALPGLLDGQQLKVQGEGTDEPGTYALWVYTAAESVRPEARAARADFELRFGG